MSGGGLELICNCRVTSKLVALWATVCDAVPLMAVMVIVARADWATKPAKLHIMRIVFFMIGFSIVLGLFSLLGFYCPFRCVVLLQLGRLCGEGKVCWRYFDVVGCGHFGFVISLLIRGLEC